MNAEGMADLPALPASEVEWEDLLLRLEIVPRVVNGVVSEAPDAGAAPLREAVARERFVGEWLEAAAWGTPPSGRADVAAESSDPRTLAERFASHRARTFAMVQRRGLGVWQWSAPIHGDDPVTVHQLLLWLARRDGVLLADLRAAASGGRGGC